MKWNFVYYDVMHILILSSKCYPLDLCNETNYLEFALQLSSCKLGNELTLEYYIHNQLEYSDSIKGVPVVKMPLSYCVALDVWGGVYE